MNSAIYHLLILGVIYSIFLLNKRINRSKSNFDNLDLLMIPQIFIDMSSKFFNNPQQPKVSKGEKKPIPTKPVKNNTQIKKTGRGN